MARTMMRPPEGREYPNICCFLEIVKSEKLVWTTALQPCYRPSGQNDLVDGHDCS
jgi:hypothetical protein